MRDKGRPHGHWRIECKESDAPGARTLWVKEFDNLITDVGLDKFLAETMTGDAYTAAWYVGLKGTGDVDEADAMDSHAGWSEITPYSDGTRRTLDGWERIEPVGG